MLFLNRKSGMIWDFDGQVNFDNTSIILICLSYFVSVSFKNFLNTIRNQWKNSSKNSLTFSLINPGFLLRIVDTFVYRRFCTVLSTLYSLYVICFFRLMFFCFNAAAFWRFIDLLGWRLKNRKTAERKFLIYFIVSFKILWGRLIDRIIMLYFAWNCRSCCSFRLLFYRDQSNAMLLLLLMLLLRNNLRQGWGRWLRRMRWTLRLSLPGRSVIFQCVVRCVRTIRINVRNSARRHRWLLFFYIIRVCWMKPET